MKGTTTRGVLFVHSASPALCPHIEWAASNAIGQEVHLQWIEQPAAPGTMRAEISWSGTVGTGARIASALRGWEHLRYEVTEEPTAVSDGSRWMHTPSLGIFHAQTDTAGNVVVSENAVRSAMETAVTVDDMRRRLHLVLGQAWDDELESYRYAGAGAPVRLLHRVS